MAVRTDMFGDTCVCDHVFIQLGFQSKHPGAHGTGEGFHFLMCQLVSAQANSATLDTKVSLCDCSSHTCLHTHTHTHTHILICMHNTHTHTHATTLICGDVQYIYIICTGTHTHIPVSTL